jgi:hypothetical protein
MVKTLKLPPRFIEDCIDCDCEVGSYDYKRRTLTANDAELAELISRAEFYADGSVDYPPPGVVPSARATLRALAKQGLTG